MNNRHALCMKAILRGLDFVYEVACDPTNFRLYGYDYLFTFYRMAVTSRHLPVRAVARAMALACARRWQAHRALLPEDADPETVVQSVFGNLAATGLGLAATISRAQLQRAARRYRAVDYFWFDTTIEQPPPDIPDDCECGASEPRGTRTCRTCGRTLDLMSPYEVWVVALIRTYIGERHRVPLGARYVDALKWLPAMRPYPRPGDAADDDCLWALYAATHVTYTLNDYNSLRLDPAWLPDEFALLTSGLPYAVRQGDPDLVGEIMDSLKSFGLAEEHRPIRAGTDYLLASQHADGSWGDQDVIDGYDRCHPTIAAINGLDEYRWRHPRLSFPEARSIVIGRESVTPAANVEASTRSAC